MPWPARRPPRWKSRSASSQPWPARRFSFTCLKGRKGRCFNMLHLTGVSFHYGWTPALDNISLSVEQGDFLGVIGPNSSGKSTLLRVMGGTRIPQEGHVELLQQRLETWSLPVLARTLTVVCSEDYF